MSFPCSVFSTLTHCAFRKSPLFRENQLNRPRLALNGIGGTSGTELLKTLCEKGVHVTYGGMSLKPVAVPTASLIFRDIFIRGNLLSAVANCLLFM